jgi:tetratricopeptide (TPR) repeat protein
VSDVSYLNWLLTAARQVMLLPYLAFHFAIDWWSTRYWSSLAWGLPALVVGLAVWSVGLKHDRMSPSGWITRYEAAAMSALRKGDLEAADIYFRRMAFLDESSPAAVYGLALTAERQTDLPRARELLRRIAPESKAGYPDAHYWLARDLIRQQASPTPQLSRVLEHHLEQALRSAHPIDARVLLAQLYATGGKTEKAIGELEQVVSARPEFQLDLASLYTLAGRTSESGRAAAKAEEFFQARTQAEPDQPLHRLRWAASQASQGRYEEAVKVLTPGLSLPDPQPFQRALAATYLAWLGAGTTQDKPNPARQLELLERVIEHDADNERALAMLADLATRKGEAADRAMPLLKRVLARGAAPAVVHLILGTRALDQGNLDQGLMHLEQARQRNARIPEVLNNLAWGLAQKEDPDLERALQLAEAAQRMSPNPEICDTVGTILAKLGRPREALTQLEKALRALPPRADIHRTLGDLYEQLGDADLAGEHRRLARQLEASPPPRAAGNREPSQAAPAAGKAGT